MAQNTPEFLDIVSELLHLDKYVPCPVHMSAAPMPSTALAMYNSHVLGHKNDTMNRLRACVYTSVVESMSNARSQAFRNQLNSMLIGNIDVVFEYCQMNGSQCHISRWTMEKAWKIEMKSSSCIMCDG